MAVETVEDQQKQLTTGDVHVPTAIGTSNRRARRRRFSQLGDIVAMKADTSDAAWSAPTLGDFTDLQWADLSAAKRRHIAGYFAHAPADAASFADLKLPYREPKSGKVNLHAVRAILAVLGGARGGVKGLSADEQHLIATRMHRYLGAVAKSADEQQEHLEKASGHYLQALMEEAKQFLPPWLHGKIHRLALPKAGGRASAEARRTRAAAAQPPAPIDKAALPTEVVLVEGFVTRSAKIEKAAAVPFTLHGQYTGRHFLLRGIEIVRALLKAANELGTVVQFEGALAKPHQHRVTLYDLVLRKVDDGNADGNADGSVRLLKVDAAQQKVWGVVMEPLVEDTQGDFEEKHEIEPAAHRFLEDYRMRKANIGHTHERPLMDEEATLCENYVTPCAMTIGSERVPAGTWIQCVHVKSPTLWKKVEDGELTGFSFGGTGTREHLDEHQVPAALKRAGQR